MLYIFCTYDTKLANGTWKNKNIHVSTHHPDTEESLTSDCITQTVDGDDVGAENMIRNVLIEGGASVTLCD